MNVRWIAVGGEAEGVIAFGQMATGVIAVGQVATGVIAIGQVARGFIAIGQGAIGVIAVGMGSVGVVWSLGMVGVGGRGFGIVFPLVPSFGPKLKAPDLRSAAEVMAGNDAGWVAARLEPGDEPALVEKRTLDVRFDVSLRGAIAARAEASPVWAHLVPRAEGWVVDSLVDVPATRWRSPGWWAFWACQLAGLVAVCLLFWFVAGIPVVSALFDPGGILVGG